MKTHKTDRRSQRTQRLVSEALVSLLLERRYDEITVQDLLDRADVGRSTFYAHYYDKDDVLTSAIEQMVAALNRRLTTTVLTDVPIPSLALFQHVQEQEHLMAALLRGRGIDLALQAFHTGLCHHVEHSLRASIPAATTRAFTTQAVVGMFLSVLRWWVESDMRVPPDHAAQLFQDLIMPGLQQLAARGEAVSS